MKGNKFKSIKNIVTVILLITMLLSPLTVLAEASGNVENSDTGGGTSQISDSERGGSSGSNTSQGSNKSDSSENKSGSSIDSSSGTSSTNNNSSNNGNSDNNNSSDTKQNESQETEIQGSVEQKSSNTFSSEEKEPQDIEEKNDTHTTKENSNNNKNSENKAESDETGKSEENALENENQKTDGEHEGILSEDTNKLTTGTSSSGASKSDSNSGNSQDISNSFPKSDNPDEELLGNTYKVELEDPGDVTKGEDKDFTMKFTEIGLHNLTLIFISVPDEFKINSVEDPVTSGGHTWKSSYSGQEIKLEADEVDPLGWFSDDRLIFGDWVSVTFNLTPKEEGTFTFETGAEWTHHRYERFGFRDWRWVRYDNPNSRHGNDPEVQVLAAAEEPEKPNGNGNGTINGPGFTGGGSGGDFPVTDFSAFFEEPAEPVITEQALTVDPEEPLVSPGDYLVIPPEDPESELEPIIDVEFVLNGTNEDLLEALAAYEVLLAYFDEFWEEMSEEEYARHLIDLSAAWAAMQVLDASLQFEAGEEINLETLFEAYELAMEHLNEYGEHLTAEQMEAATAVMGAVAELIESLAEELDA